MAQMKRGRSQVIWRFLPGAIYRYNETGGWCKTTEVMQKSSKPLVGALAQTVQYALNQWDALGPTGYPDPILHPTRYSVGEPHYVIFELWPLVFNCRSCRAVTYYSDINRLLEINPTLKCYNCHAQNALRQISYAYVCECGNIQNVYIPQHENRHKIVMIDKGSFRESYWFCENCEKPLQRNSRDGLGFRTCVCNNKKPKGMHGVPLEDSSVYYSQTVDMVDVQPDILKKWQNNPHFNDLLLAAVTRASVYKPSDIYDLAEVHDCNYGLSHELQVVRDRLVDRGWSLEEAEKEVQAVAKATSQNTWHEYEQSLAKIRMYYGNHNLQNCRRNIEYVFVRDELSVSSIALKTLIEESFEHDDLITGNRLLEEQNLAKKLGLVELRVVQSLPILLAGIGYSRFLAGPSDTLNIENDINTTDSNKVKLRSYPEVNDHKIPIYTASNTTEAILYELDPWRLAAYLILNTGLEIPEDVLVSESLLRAFLLNCASRLMETSESHFVLKTYEVQRGITVDDTSALIFGLLHTISHLLKATAYRYVGVDGDSLSEYLFPGLFAGLLYVSSHVNFTLGGIDSVFRSNLGQWLGTMRDYAKQCSFDPVCTQSGGACMACLYTKFGCSYFNRTLSRAFLFGGKIIGRENSVIGFWTSNVIEKADFLRERAVNRNDQ